MERPIALDQHEKSARVWLAVRTVLPRPGRPQSRPDAPPVDLPTLHTGRSGLLTVMWHHEGPVQSGMPPSYSRKTLSSSLLLRVTRTWPPQIYVAGLLMAAHS